MFIVAGCTAALIIALSVFNGLEGLLKSLYSSFDPEIRVTATQGKSFIPESGMIEGLEAIEGVAIVTEVVEDYAYIRYRDADMIVTLKGVGDNFLGQHRMDTALIGGEMKLKMDDVNYALIGWGIKNALSINIGNDLYPIQVYYIKDIKSGRLDPSKSYNKKLILPGGIFSIEKNIDENYMLTPLDFAVDLLDYGEKRTSLEIKTTSPSVVRKVQKAIRTQLSDDYKVENREEQHADLYKLLKLEKLFMFIALSAILAIGSINILFSLSMLAIDKKKDIAVLYAMGAHDTIIRRIFLAEGAIISLGGAFLGLAIGGVVCWLQQHYGLVSMGMETSVLDNYPVKVQWMDFVYTCLTIVAITMAVSIRPAAMATRYNSINNL